MAPRKLGSPSRSRRRNQAIGSPSRSRRRNQDRKGTDGKRKGKDITAEQGKGKDIAAGKNKTKGIMANIPRARARSKDKTKGKGKSKDTWDQDDDDEELYSRDQLWAAAMQQYATPIGMIQDAIERGLDHVMESLYESIESLRHNGVQ